MQNSSNIIQKINRLRSAARRKRIHVTVPNEFDPNAQVKFLMEKKQC
jgi:predicted metal-dependent hydrolase